MKNYFKKTGVYWACDEVATTQLMTFDLMTSVFGLILWHNFLKNTCFHFHQISFWPIGVYEKGFFDCHIFIYSIHPITIDLLDETIFHLEKRIL